MEVNKGPQKHRGNTSYISHILHRIDKSFRTSMYNHNRIFLDENCHNKLKKDSIYIPKSCFSYKNIHMNLGKIRFFSTTNKFYSLQLKSQDNSSLVAVGIITRFMVSFISLVVLRANLSLSINKLL